MARYSVGAVPVPAPENEPESLEFPRYRRWRTWCQTRSRRPMRVRPGFERRRLLMDDCAVCLE